MFSALLSNSLGKYPLLLIFFFSVILFHFLAALHVMQDLSSPTRNQTRAPCSGSADRQGSPLISLKSKDFSIWT